MLNKQKKCVASAQCHCFYKGKEYKVRKFFNTRMEKKTWKKTGFTRKKILLKHFYQKTFSLGDPRAYTAFLKKINVSESP